MKKKYLIVLLIAPAVFILDLFTKWWVLKTIPLGGGIEVIPGYFDIIHARNIGAAFGMFADSASTFRVPFFYIIAVLAVIAIAAMLWKMRDDERILPVTFALILGGIAGNILDRIRFGSVVDFLSVHWRDVVFDRTLFGWHLQLPLDWPAFNVADSAITTAMVLLIISAFRTPKTPS
jgi:signal peptidase II